MNTREKRAETNARKRTALYGTATPPPGQHACAPRLTGLPADAWVHIHNETDDDGNPVPVDKDHIALLGSICSGCEVRTWCLLDAVRTCERSSFRAGYRMWNAKDAVRARAEAARHGVEEMSA